MSNKPSDREGYVVAPQDLKHTNVWCCKSCGAFVGLPDEHDKFHERLGLIAQHAYRAVAFTAPIGAPQMPTDEEVQQQVQDFFDRR